jgi:predicted dehydrogenase
LKLGFGLIGLGRHGTRYAESLKGMEGAQLIAVCRRDLSRAEEFASSWGAKRAYADYGELIRDREVDAVVVVTPNSTHGEIAIEAAEYRKHVLVEKPIARSSAEAEGMVSAARRNGINLMVGHTFRYHPMTTEAMRFLGEIGEVFLAAMCKRQQRSTGWRLDPQERGGAIMDIGVHLFDLTRFILKERPTSVQCNCKHVLGLDVEDSFGAILELSKERLALLDASACSNGRTDRMEFAGREGHLATDRYRRELQLVLGDKRRGIPLVGSDATLHLLLGDFVRSIKEGREPPITGEDGLEAVRIAEACYRSSEGRCKVFL